LNLAIESKPGKTEPALLRYEAGEGKNLQFIHIKTKIPETTV